MKALGGLDLFLVALYFLATLRIGYGALRRKKDESADYFLAGRDVAWLPIGASLFAINIGGEHLVGLAGTGASSGLAVSHFEWLAAVLTALRLHAVGGWSGLEARVPPEFFKIWKPASHPNFPLDRHRVRRPDPGRLVLVHRPVHGSARPGRAQRERGAPRHDLRGVPQAAPVRYRTRRRDAALSVALAVMLVTLWITFR